MVNAACPICGKVYSIPEGRGREMVVTKFLAHKDSCQLPGEDEFVMVGGRIGVVVDTRPGHELFPLYEVQMPSGRSNVFRASEISRLDDQEHGKRRFFE